MKKYILFSIIVFSALWVLSPSVVSAANHYIRAGATGANNGSDWTNAYSSLPSILVRGDTYYIADGTYGGYAFDDSGTSIITIKKATIGDHGTNTGWQDSYGGGQAVFATLTFKTSYYVINGVTRNENSWQQTASYGFRISSVYASSFDGSTSQNITVQYADIGGTNGSICNDDPGSGFYAIYGGLHNWTIRRCHIHNVGIPFRTSAVNNWIIEYCHIGPSWSKEAISSEETSGWIVRYNRFIDNLIFPPPACQHGGDGGTADIWSRVATGMNDNWQIYGNVFGDSGTYNNIVRTNAVILGNYWGSPSDGVSNWKVYNNVFYNIQGDYNLVKLGDGTGNVVANNLWYKSRQSGASLGIVGGTIYTSWCYSTPYTSQCDNLAGAKVLGSEDPFVDAANFDFRLKSSFSGGSPINAGTNLGTGFDAVDGFGNTRGTDGTWDIGAYEYGGTTICTSHSYFSCYSGDVYWYDSCGNREDLKEECGSNTCSGGACQTSTQICGNNIREGTEACDGTDLAGQSCISQGFTGGTLTCNSQCIGFVTTACTSQTGNLLTNGDFESGFTGGIANSWNLVTDGSVAYSLSQDTGYQGSSQKITISSSGIWGLFFYQTPAFQLNQFYNWSFWYKTLGTGGLTAEITNALDTQVVYSASLALTNGAWQYKTITFQYTNSLADELRFYSNSPGSYWVDNVSLTLVSADTTSPASPTGLQIQ